MALNEFTFPQVFKMTFNWLNALVRRREYLKAVSTALHLKAMDRANRHV